MRREFYYLDDRSNKFWTIEVVDGDPLVGLVPEDLPEGKNLFGPLDGIPVAASGTDVDLARAYWDFAELKQHLPVWFLYNVLPVGWDGDMLILVTPEPTSGKLRESVEAIGMFLGCGKSRRTKNADHPQYC